MQRNKLIAVGAGLFGFGVFWGWSIGVDLNEKKNREFLETKNQLIDLQAQRLNEMQQLLESIPLSEEEIEEISKGQQQMDEEAYTQSTDETEKPEITKLAEDLVGTTPEGNVAYSDADEVVEPENSPEVPPGETVQETRSKLEAHIRRYVSDDDEVHTFESQILANAESDKAPPFIISHEEFASGEDEGDKYDKIAVTYYPGDRVLVDEDENVLNDVNAVVGWQNLNSWGDRSDDPNVVFVRNRRLRTDYEVIRDEENRPPVHVIYGMDKDDYKVQKAANTLRFRPEDM